MMLTVLTRSDLPPLLDAFAAGLRDDPLASRVFAHIAATAALITDDALPLSQDPLHHAQALELLRKFGMGIIDEPPTASYTWDGQAVRVRMEPSVIIHEVAHLQLCAPERRSVPDFGLGAGPETGCRSAADRLMSVFGPERELEESLTSLLGILWEARLAQPALLAFVEQNWLEGATRPHHWSYFRKVTDHLYRYGFIGADGWPRPVFRTCDDQEFLTSLVQPAAA